MRYLLDANFLSELIRPQPNRGVIEWDRFVEPDDLALSVITIGEIQRAIAQLRDPARVDPLQRWLDAHVRPRFAGRTIPFDQITALAWGRRYGELARAGKKLPLTDSMLAATALVHNLTIVTRNVHDFEEFGVATVNPWEGEL